MSTVIQVDRLSKRYRLGTIGGKRLVDDVNRWWAKLRGQEDPLSKVGSVVRSQKPEASTPPIPISDLRPLTSEQIWALKDISFEVKQGEVLGIIGRNGAGKSTLLKVLSRVTAPTSGVFRVKGRIASLLEVGTGFHPELTGRENVFLNGAILGMSKVEIRMKFDEIVDFSGVEQFIDTPVKRYSSGMSVRLAFAVAAHLDPEILIIDEVLAVGDIEFQRKCLGRMKEVAGEGRTVLFVSHNMAAVRTLCLNGMVLEKGVLVKIQTAADCVSFYERRDVGTSQGNWMRPMDLPKRELLFLEARIEVAGRQPDLCLMLNVSLKSQGRHLPAFLAFDILDQGGAAIMQAIPQLSGFIKCENLRHRISVKIALPPMVPGHYSVTLWAGPHNTETLDLVQGVLGFDISDSPTPGRTFPHHVNHGYIVPQATLDILE